MPTALAPSRNECPTWTKRTSQIGTKAKALLYHRNSFGVAFLNRSPDAKRAIQINSQGGITADDT